MDITLHVTGGTAASVNADIIIGGKVIGSLQNIDRCDFTRVCQLLLGKQFMLSNSTKNSVEI